VIIENDFAGKWNIVEALDMADDYLDLTPDSRILIDVKGKNEVVGDYQFGAQDGFIDGHFERDKEDLRLIFSFEGSDEGNDTSDFGIAVCESLDTLLMKMYYHMGDAYSLRCKRD